MFDSEWRYENHYMLMGFGDFKQSKEELELNFHEGDDSRFLHEFQLEPFKRYKATVHAKATNIISQSNIGVNICLYGTWTHSSEFNNGLGTFEGDLSLSFRAPENGKVVIGLRLGFWCNESKGKVVFSNFNLDFDYDVVEIGEGIVRIDIPIDLLSVLDTDVVEKWLSYQNDVYFEMAQLYGSCPFNGEVIHYESRANINCYAYAGNPIVWEENCMKNYFYDRLFLHEDACFGTIHEMGHNFDMTRLSKINCELMANFGLCYAVESLNLPIKFDKELTYGKGLQDGFYKRCYEKSILKGKYHHDGFLYCLLRIKDNIGWKPFEQVMRKLIENPPDDLNSNELVKLWLSMLSKESNVNVETFFLPNELELIFTTTEF